MPLTKIAAENFTVFEDIKIPFCEGLNVLVGENGVGKTTITKLITGLYSDFTGQILINGMSGF